MCVCVCVWERETERERVPFNSTPRWKVCFFEPSLATPISLVAMPITVSFVSYKIWPIPKLELKLSNSILSGNKRAKTGLPHWQQSQDIFLPPILQLSSPSNVLTDLNYIRGSTRSLFKKIEIIKCEKKRSNETYIIWKKHLISKEQQNQPPWILQAVT